MTSFEDDDIETRAGAEGQGGASMPSDADDQDDTDTDDADDTDADSTDADSDTTDPS
jgi:hypothetical protein